VNDLISEWEFKEEINVIEKLRVEALEDYGYVFKIAFPFELKSGEIIKFKEGLAVFMARSRIDGLFIFKFIENE